ncbi:MAG: heparinase [Devosia sp.]|uniref:heparinase II/III family protein n=1 Tax=Devosia sp. TaxID=1871048 RepID=UPI0026335629|nr:heparinase II/III-family protein [Devosia sp.]MDB5530990.1 heparinase [Devosia sp.]
MKLAWYVARLRNMSPGEVLHRLVETQRRSASRKRHEGWDRFSAGALPIALPGLRSALLAAPASHEAIAKAAEAIMDGRFAALGLEWPRRAPSDLFPSSLWQLSPDTGKSWPADTYCFDINYRQTAGVGDIKYAWEFNRLQFLQPLAAKVALSGGVAEVAAIEQAIESWYTANPPFRGIGWASGIEVGLRAISLLLVVSLCGERLSQPTLLRIGAILGASAFWLHRFPSDFSSANNHLMAELAGCYLIAMALDDKTVAAGVLADVEREVMLQILPDGVGAEQTPTYAAFTAEMALLCGLVAQNAGTPFAAEVADRLGLFADFIFWISGPDGTAPAIGDDDEGRVIGLCQPEPDYPVSVAVAVRGFLRQSAPTAAAATLRNAIFPAPIALDPVASGARTFPVGGYSVWRGQHTGRQVGAVLDHGPLGYLSIAAHGHADALSLKLAIDGKPVLVDPGTYRYQGGGAWRDWFRSSQAHNTMTVANSSQSLAAGAFNWSHKARTRLESKTDYPWRVTASHDGYQRRFGVRHQRITAMTEQGMTISDSLSGASSPLDCELTFQLAPDLVGQIDGNAVAVSRAGKPICRLVLPTGAIQIIRGGGPTEGGWVSTRFGHKDPADRIVWSGEVGTSGVTTNIQFDRRRVAR